MPHLEPAELDDIRFRQEHFDKRPLADTPAALLAECEWLRGLLLSPWDGIYAVALAGVIRERLWDTMRRIGGVVPPEPSLADCELHTAFADSITDASRRSEVNRMIDSVVSWCAAAVEWPAGAADQPDVDDEEIAILKALERERPKLLSGVEIEAACGVSRKTVTNRLKESLMPAGLVERPRGKNTGNRITDKGRKLLATRKVRKEDPHSTHTV